MSALRVRIKKTHVSVDMKKQSQLEFIDTIKESKLKEKKYVLATKFATRNKGNFVAFIIKLD